MKFFKILFFAFLSLFLVGCGPTIENATVAPNIIKGQGAYAECADDNYSQFLQHKLNQHLRGRNIYGKDIKVVCKVPFFDGGDEAMRTYGMIGSGMGETATQVEFFDINGKSIGTMDLSHYTIGAGNATGMLAQISLAIVDQLKTHYLTK